MNSESRRTKLCIATSCGLYLPCRKKPQMSSSPGISLRWVRNSQVQRNSANSQIPWERYGSLSLLVQSFMAKT
jgi:hypothetical protein